MRKRLFSSVICLLLAASLLMPLCGGLRANASKSDLSEVNSLIEGAILYKQKESGESSVQGLINGTLAKSAGTAGEWYVLSLRQYEKGYDFSEYASALNEYVSRNSIDNAVVRQRCALMLVACGYSSKFVENTANSSIGTMGIMSDVFGLHLLNNGIKSSKHSADDVIESLISQRLSDGGWAVSGNTSDVDVTAMVIQALAPHCKANQSVKTAVDAAVSLLSLRQLSSGNFKSYGAENPESTAQVITALSALGIDCLNDGRFIKDGNNMLSGLKKYLLADGSFSHAQGGGSNNTATFQALYSLVSLWRNMSGYGSLYIFPYPTKTFSSQQVTAPPVVTTPAPSEAAPIITTSEATTTYFHAETQPATSVAATTKRAKATKPAAAAAASSTAAVSSKAQQTAVTAKTTTQIVESCAATADEPSAGSLSSAATEAAEAKISEGNYHSRPNYRRLAVIAVWVLAGAACAILFARGKRKAVDYIAVVLIAALLTGAAFAVKIESAGEYYSGTSAPCADESAVTVTMSIRCDTIAGKSDKDYIPADGAVLNTAEFTVSAGSTVFDVLMLAAKQYNIQVENDAQTGGSYSSAYIAGINYIYEFDFGNLSGWMYRVNGETPSVGCGEYVLSGGDEIEWLYTCNLGDDLK